MQLQRNEVLTGLLVIGTIGVIAFSSGLCSARRDCFGPWSTYKVYFDNAAGIKPGAVVMLAGRKIGQVQKTVFTLTSAEEKQAQQARAAIHLPNLVRALPTPRLKPRVGCASVDKRSPGYRDLLRLFFFGRGKVVNTVFGPDPIFPTGQHYTAPGLNSGGIIEIHLVGDQGPKQSRRAEQDQKKRDHADRARSRANLSGTSFSL